MYMYMLYICILAPAGTPLKHVLFVCSSVVLEPNRTFEFFFFLGGGGGGAMALCMYM